MARQIAGFAAGALFGLGWGRAGFCPGPALAALGFGGWRPALFVLAMLAGMALFHVFGRPQPMRAAAARR